MREIRVYYFLDACCLCELCTIFSMLHDELASPQSISGGTESTADGRSLWVAEKTELRREEKIEHLLWTVAPCPERKVWM